MARKSIFLAVAAIGVAAVVSAAVAQSPYGAQQSAPQTTSKGFSAIERAAAADRYLFVFFWREKSQQTSNMWGVFQAATSKLAERADAVAVNVSDPAERPMVARFGTDRSPLPLVLALAPNGAVTKGFPGRLTEDQLSQAFVSPGTANCLKALQDRKLVLLCVQNSATQFNVSAIQGARDFQADPRYAAHTEVILLNSAETAEASFLKGLQIDPQAPQPVTVLMAPPGSVVGTFVGNVTKAELIAKLNSPSSCGPHCSCHH